MINKEKAGTKSMKMSISYLSVKSYAPIRYDFSDSTVQFTSQTHQYTNHSLLTSQASSVFSLSFLSSSPHRY